MPNRLVPDLGVFYSGDFAESVTIGSTVVSGLFSDPFAGEIDIPQSAPEFSAPTADLSFVSGGETLLRSSTGASYRVLSRHEDGEGVTSLLLRLL